MLFLIILQKESSLNNCPDGGIGRRAGLKNQFLFGVPVRPRLRVLGYPYGLDLRSSLVI